jgi:hypothetical protein
VAMVAVAARGGHVVAAAVATEVAVAAVEAETADPQGLFAHPCARTDRALGLNSGALFILNTHSKIQKLRNSHGHRTYSLHHQA